MERKTIRRRVLDQLYVGSLDDCRAVAKEGWAVVHACRNPCYCDKCGKKPDPKSPHYLSFQEGAHLYLNIIDPKLPLFQRKSFEDFLRFARLEWQAGKPLLIHCNQGHSRAPSLALLFLAKVLAKISNASYDDAWLDFEKLAGEPYRPGEGIEVWLREHWKELDGGARLPSLDGAESATARGEPLPVPDLTLPTDPEGNDALIRQNTLIHFAGFTEIEDKNHKYVQPIPNSLQFDIDAAYEWCMANNVPCRLMALKPRQVGCSTKCGHLCYHHMRRFKSDMIVMGDVAKRTEKVYAIFNDFARHDAYSQQWGSTYEFNTIGGRFVYNDGSFGLVEHDTALDSKAGIAGTRQVVWLTEAARYMKKDGRDKKVITAVLNSLADVPRSLGIMESTAEGAVGIFYEMWQNAVTLADRKKGIVGNGWIKVFASWFAFAEHSLSRTPENLEFFEKDLNDRERRGILLYNWTGEQIAWRRKKILTDCANDERIFDQDFPEDEQSAFLASGRPRFDMRMLTKWEARAKMNHGLAETGAVERMEDGTVGFVPKRDGDAWLWCIERPKPGLKYIGFIDPCTGAQNEGSAFPDAHACGILRAAYMEENRYYKPRLAAMIDVPNGCRWDDPFLAKKIKAILEWYGDCMIVPETGNGLGVLNALQNEHALIYAREKMDNMYPGQSLRVAGWDTNVDTRPIVVNAMADAISQDSIDIEYLPAILEMKTFTIGDRGRAAAKSGCFIAGTEILTESGCKPIELVDTNDRVFTHLGNLHKVGKPMRRRYSGPLVTLKISGLPFPIQATNEHPFWAKKRKDERQRQRLDWKVIESAWIAAESLRSGDWVAIPKRRNLVSSGLTDEQLYAVGLWLAEGHMDAKGHGIHITNTDRSMLERAANALAPWFPSHTARPHGGRKEDRHKLVTRPSHFRITHRDRGGNTKRSYSLSFVSSEAFDYFEQFGGGQAHRHLGSLANCSGLDSLLVGLIDGDGSQRKNQQHDVNYYTISWKLARQLWQSLIDSSVWATCRKGKPRIGKSGSVHAPCWTINIKAKYLSRFLGGKLAPHTMRRAVNHVIEEEGAFFTPIRSVEVAQFDGEVFNFSVRGDESYIAGGVAVHNCHDDFVMGLGIGIKCLDFARTLPVPYLYARSDQEAAIDAGGGLSSSAFS